MTTKVNITIDGKPYEVEENKPLVHCAKELGIFIPTLCDYKSLSPSGTCRMCTVKAHGAYKAACTIKTYEGLEVDNSCDDIIELRKAILEMMFIEGNHICPVCEKSGNCELQSLAYHYQMSAPRFPHLYPKRHLDASAPNLMVEYNRCIQCRRCVRGIRTKENEAFFFFESRGHGVQLVIDPSRYKELSPKIAKAAARICPVGALLRKEPGYQTPIGKRHFDEQPKQFHQEVEND